MFIGMLDKEYLKANLVNEDKQLLHYKKIMNNLLSFTNKIKILKIKKNNKTNNKKNK